MVMFRKRSVFIGIINSDIQGNKYIRETTFGHFGDADMMRVFKKEKYEIW